MKIKHILNALLFTTLITSSSQAQESSSQTLLLETYGKNDLATKPAFQGGYINFGYWKGLWPKKGAISLEERIKASEALYDLIIDHLSVTSNDTVLEVGSGKGYGCVKVMSGFKPKKVTGMDITPEQTARSRQIHQNIIQDYAGSLEFINAASSPLPFEDESYSKIYSVEAAQCFPSMDAFAREAWRILKPGGRLVLTAHFAVDAKGYDALKKLIPTVAQDVDRLIPIDDVRAAFHKAGFLEVAFDDIGEHVFEGFDQWISQIDDVPWGKMLLDTHKNSSMSYYVIVLEKK